MIYLKLVLENSADLTEKELKMFKNISERIAEQVRKSEKQQPPALSLNLEDLAQENPERIH